MSHEDSVDDEVIAILAKADADDSTESNISKKITKKTKANDEYNTYETNTLESPDSEW